jgi:signal transduction histidine kinase
MLRQRLKQMFLAPGSDRAPSVPIKHPAGYALLTGVALLVSLVLTWLVGAETPTVSDWLAFAFFTVAAAVSVVISAQVGNITLSPATVFCCAAALALPVPLGLLVVPLAGVVDGIRRRIGYRRASANIGIHALSAALAIAVLKALLGLDIGSGAYVLAGGTWLVTNIVVLTAITSLHRGVPLRQARPDQESVMSEVLMALLGTLAAALYGFSPTMMLLGIAPALILRRTLRLPLIRAEAERQTRELEHERLRVAELEELHRLRDAFVATVTHDLRSPLTSIVGYGELLEEGEFGPVTVDQRRAFKIIGRNSDHLLALVDDLLLASRPDDALLDLFLETVDLRELLLEAVETARPQASGAGVSIACSLPVSLQIAGDRRRLVQVVTNLLSNAVKYTLTGGTVTIAGHVADGRVVVTFADTGIGISKADCDNLFTRFFRCSEALDRQIPGTGLGLVVTKKIVDAHDAVIAVHSTPGVGTTFTLEFTAAEAHAPARTPEMAA